MGSLFDIINVPMGYVIRFFYNLTNNYALTLLLFAIVAKAVLFPFGIKQQKNSVQMAKLRPKEAVIRKKYAGRNDKATQAKLNEEIMALYKEENYNVFGGCLPLLIQMPIIMALYSIIRSPLTYISQFSKELIETLTAKALDLTNAGLDPDKAVKALDQTQVVKLLGEKAGDFAAIFTEAGVTYQPMDLTLFGVFDLTARPSFDFSNGFPWLIIIPILNFAISFVSMKATRKFTYQPQAAGTDGQTQMSNKLMDVTMPLLSLWIAFQMASSIGLYWIFQSLLAILQSFILFKMFPIPKVTEADIAAAEAKYGSKKKKKAPKESDEVIEGEYKELDESDDAVTPEGKADETPKLSQLPKGISSSAQAKYSKTGKKYNVKKKK